MTLRPTLSRPLTPRKITASPSWSLANCVGVNNSCFGFSTDTFGLASSRILLERRLLVMVRVPRSALNFLLVSEDVVLT